MRVVVVSTHRSDKAHYAPLLRCLRATPGLEVVLYAANDFYARPDYDRSIHLDNASRGKHAQGFDAGVVLGDRYEMLVAAAQLVEARIPLLHIHGGEHTYGSLDERWRWAITAMADEHCVATWDASWEIERIGADDIASVHFTGAPGLDDIHDRQPFPNAPKIVVLYNPAIDEDTTRLESRAIWDATLPTHDITFIKPNGDRFSDLIPWNPRGHEYDSEKFRDLLAAAHVIVGNSSAGIIEAPSLGTWTVNVGERQAGRPRAASVYDETASAPDIRAEIMALLDRPRAIVANPYGDGHASERIRDVLLSMGGMK